MAKQIQQYTDQQLYGINGQPHLADIKQDWVYDCYLVSSMGALAAQQPDRIRDAIRYETDPNNPSAGVFHVALNHPTRGAVDVPVTQADIEDNIKRDGGGTADNKKGSPIWPSVMEAAFAKLHDPNSQDNSLDDAYKVIGNQTRGGSLHEAMFALTGDKGHNLRYDQSPQGHSGPPGSSSKHEEPPSFNVKLYEKDVTRFDDANSAYTKINEALGSGNPVTLSTRSAIVNDGVSPHHAYIITGIEQHEKKDGSNEVLITLRNPYAKNNNDPAESKDTSKPSITVSLDKMLKDEVFGEINIGPAPRVQTQQQSTPTPNKNDHPEASAPIGPPVAGLNTSDRNNKEVVGLTTGLQIGNDFREKDHPGNARYERMLDEVQRMETTNGITSGPNTPLIAAALTVKAEQNKFFVAEIVRMEPDGQVSALKLNPFGPEAKVSVDPKEVVAQGQSFEKSTEQWSQARSRHYAGDTPAAERTLEQVKAFGQLSPSDQAMHEKIRENVPSHISDDVVTKALLHAKRKGVSNVDQIDNVAMAGDSIMVRGRTPGMRSTTDVNEPAAPMAETVKQTESFNQQLAIDMRLQQEQSLAKKQEQENQGNTMQMAGGMVMRGGRTSES